MSRALIYRAACSAALTLSLSVFSSRISWAQEPTQTPPATTEDKSSAEEPLPPDVTVLPKTTVTAPAFPRDPLPSDTVVSAGLAASNLRTTGSSVTIITEQQLTATGARTLDQALRATVPGLNVAASGGPGQPTGIFTRGTNSSHTKVVIDGIPLNDPTSPNRAFDPSKLLIDNIERIEVIRGPQSTTFGSDAIGGVVNIVTKRGTGPMKASSTAYGGSFGTFSQTTNVSGGNEKFYYSVSGGWFQTDGISAAAAGTERDGFSNGSLSGRLGLILTEALDVDYVFRFTESDVDFDDFNSVPPFIPVDAGRNLDNQNFAMRTQLRYTQFDGDLEHRVGFTLNRVKRDERGAGALAFPQPTFFDGESRKVDYQASLNILSEDWITNRLTFGGEYYVEESVQQGFAEVSQFDRAGYVEEHFGFFDRLFVTAGYRHDDYSRAGAADTYRVSTRYNIDEWTGAVHGSVGKAFRAPALAENALGFFFNPTLRPERSTGFDVGYEQRLAEGRVILDATYFENDLTDLITFAFVPVVGLQNVDRARTRGVELTSTTLLTDTTRLIASYTHQDTEDLTTGRELLRRPRHQVALRLSQMLLEERANASLGLRYVSSAQDVGGVALRDYVLLDVSGWYQLTPSVRLFARGENLTDENYQEVFGYQTPGLSGFAGVTIDFGPRETE